MTRNKRQTRLERRRAGKIRPDFDGLEFRLAMSGVAASLPSSLSAGSSVIATWPASGLDATVERSTTALTVDFSRPLNSFSLSNSDFSLDVTSGDTAAGDPDSPHRTINLTESLDPTGSRITLMLAQPLGAGQYRLMLSPQAGLMTQDGTPIGVSGQSVDVSDFTVNPQALWVASAVDLGVPTSTESVQPDQLDLSTDPTASKLYKLTLPAGHFWRLGLEISARSDGGSLASELSLYDSEGSLISTASHGQVGTFTDPYLFAGLKAGTYYVAVSAAGVVPGPGDDAMTPVSAIPTNQPSGLFRLHFVADAADQATEVIGLRVDHADPETTNPTGLTLQFSGSIQAANLDDSSHTAVRLIDAQGQSWSATPILYDQGTASLSLAFDQTLPAGHYTVAIGDPGTLADLAGLTPVATGQPVGILGSFDVGRIPMAADDLGTLLPGTADSDTSKSVVIPALGSVTERFTVVQTGEYHIQVAGASVRPLLLGSRTGSNLQIPIGMTATSTGFNVNLAPGTYSIILTNLGLVATKATLDITEPSLSDSLVESGVGQGPALGLRAIAPVVDSSSVSNQPVGPTNTASASTPAPGVASTGPAASATGTATTVAAAGQVQATPSTAYFLVGGPVGHPGATASLSGSAGAPSFSGSNAPPSLGEIPEAATGRPGSSFRVFRSAADPEMPDLGGVPVAMDPTPACAPPTELAGVGNDPAISRDRRALAEAEWLDEMIAWTIDQLGSSPDRVQIASSPLVALGTPEEPHATEEAPTRIASFASPLGFGIATLAYLRYRKARKEKQRVTSSRLPVVQIRPAIKGPHRMGRSQFARVR